MPGQGALWGPLHVERDDDEFKLFYHTYGAYPGLGQETDPRYACLATSRDGLHFERPELGRYEFNGSKQNNIIDLKTNLGGQGHGWLDARRFAPDEPPEFRYKTVFWMGPGAQGLRGHGVGFSHDGLLWRPWKDNPVVQGRNSGDVVTCATTRDWFHPLHSAPMPPSKYALFPKTHVFINGWRRRSIAVCVSDDDPASPPFTKFFDRQLALTPDILDDDMAADRLIAARDILTYDNAADYRCEFYGMFVFRCGDVFLGMLWVYDASCSLERVGGKNQYALVEVQLAASRDLFHWKRLGGRLPIIPRGAPDAFDSHMIFYHTLPVEVGDEWWIYYVGHNEGHAIRNGFTPEMRDKFRAEVQAGRRFLPSIGLGRIRKEGFFSLDAGSIPAELVTRPVVTDAPQLFLNANVAPGGHLRVELRDEAGRPLPGYSYTDCKDVAGDGVRLRVSWKVTATTPVWTGQPVRLAFRAQNTALYGFVFA
ncbi:MAG: hypothetical protein ABR497_04355 [Kiritimatiellia bacterium]|nr:hypothetical protein [Lentisphaerota bacterium]